jgi:hypothetical protein
VRLDLEETAEDEDDAGLGSGVSFGLSSRSKSLTIMISSQKFHLQPRPRET